jgi:hypothetical protein
MAVDQGADEIDMVISRGRFHAGDTQYVFDEIAAVKEACKTARLKVILETGELGTLDNVRKASDIAIAAGADFIKTRSLLRDGPDGWDETGGRNLKIQIGVALLDYGQGNVGPCMAGQSLVSFWSQFTRQRCLDADRETKNGRLSIGRLLFTRLTVR